MEEKTSKNRISFDNKNLSSNIKTEDYYYN